MKDIHRDMRDLWAGLYDEPAEEFVRHERDLTYQRAAEWLDQPGWYVQDWGGGRGRAGHFFKHARYQVVDGSIRVGAVYPIARREPVITVDLQQYQSVADGILLRHVLEHNHNWAQILGNAIVSFERRLVLVIFTPFAETTREITTNWLEIPDLSFNKDELLLLLREWLVKEEFLVTDTQYKGETMFYFERPR